MSGGDFGLGGFCLRGILSVFFWPGGGGGCPGGFCPGGFCPVTFYYIRDVSGDGACCFTQLQYRYELLYKRCIISFVVVNLSPLELEV